MLIFKGQYSVWAEGLFLDRAVCFYFSLQKYNYNQIIIICFKDNSLNFTLKSGNYLQPIFGILFSPSLEGSLEYQK